MNYTIIQSKRQYQEYCDRVLELASKKSTKQIELELELIELLIDKWDKDHYKRKTQDPIELLKYLMENHGLSRNDLKKLLGLERSAISQILSYKKGLSKRVIRILSDHFKVSQEAFNRPYPIKSDANKGHKDEKRMNTTKVLQHA
jgi:HTH-type transcriptional regulator/antitoxin HigA